MPELSRPSARYRDDDVLRHGVYDARPSRMCVLQRYSSWGKQTCEGGLKLIDFTQSLAGSEIALPVVQLLVHWGALEPIPCSDELLLSQDLS